MVVLNRIRIARLAISQAPGSGSTRLLVADVLDECERAIQSLDLQRQQVAERLQRLSREVETR